MTRTVATRYRSASNGAKTQILDELCATTCWHRDHARKALRQALGPRPVGRRRREPAAVRPPRYGEDVMAAFRKVRAVLMRRPENGWLRLWATWWPGSKRNGDIFVTELRS